MNEIVPYDIGDYLQLRQLDEFMIGHKGYIAGGVFKNIFNHESYKDVDVFFENEADYTVARKMFSDSNDYSFKYQNDKVIAFIHNKRGVVVELIKYMYSKPVDLLHTFDFTITKFVYFKEIKDEEVEWKVAFHNKFFEHLHMKRLVIDNEVNEISKPVNTFNRMFRYGKYGYFPCRGTKSKIIDSLRNLPAFNDEDLSLELYNGLD